jgi:hypothetical protein
MGNRRSATGEDGDRGYGPQRRRWRHSHVRSHCLSSMAVPLLALCLTASFGHGLAKLPSLDGLVKGLSVPVPDSPEHAAPFAVISALRKEKGVSSLDLHLPENPADWLSPKTKAYRQARKEAGIAPDDCSDLLVNATLQDDGTYILWSDHTPWLPPRHGQQVQFSSFFWAFLLGDPLSGMQRFKTKTRLEHRQSLVLRTPRVRANSSSCNE